MGRLSPHRAQLTKNHRSDGEAGIRRWRPCSRLIPFSMKTSSGIDAANGSPRPAKTFPLRTAARYLNPSLARAAQKSESTLADPADLTARKIV